MGPLAPKKMTLSTTVKHVASPTYVDYLPLDILVLIAPYVLYDGQHNHEQKLACLNQPLFHRLTASVQWSRLLEEYPRVIYCTQWSSKDVIVQLFLTPSGTIDYKRALPWTIHAMGSYSHPSDALPSELHNAWICAHRGGYDLRLAYLRGQIADHLRAFRAATTNPAEQSVYLGTCLRLPDLLAVPHAALADEIIILVAATPSPDFVLRQPELYSVHYNLWVTLYTSYIDPRVGARLCYREGENAPDAEIIYWRSMWLHAALRSDGSPVGCTGRRV